MALHNLHIKLHKRLLKTKTNHSKTYPDILLRFFTLSIARENEPRIQDHGYSSMGHHNNYLNKPHQRFVFHHHSRICILRMGGRLAFTCWMDPVGKIVELQKLQSGWSPQKAFMGLRNKNYHVWNMEPVARRKNQDREN